MIDLIHYAQKLNIITIFHFANQSFENFMGVNKTKTNIGTLCCNYRFSVTVMKTVNNEK